MVKGFEVLYNRYIDLILTQQKRCYQGPVFRCHNSEISWVVKNLTPRGMHILWCMGSKFCVEVKREALKFDTKFWIHIPQICISPSPFFCAWVPISLNCDVINLCSQTGARFLTIQHRTNITRLILFEFHQRWNDIIIQCWTPMNMLCAEDLCYTNVAQCQYAEGMPGISWIITHTQGPFVQSCLDIAR